MKNTKQHIVLSSLLLLINTHTSIAETVQHNLRVDGITCPFCVASSAKALKKIDGVEAIDADLEKGIIKVCAEKATDMNDEKLNQLFLDKGFKYRDKETIKTCELNEE